MNMTRNLIDFIDITPDEFEALYALFEDIMHSPGDFIDRCRGKVSANLFMSRSVHHADATSPSG